VVAIETLAGGGAERVALDLVRHWPPDHAKAVLLVASRRGEYLAGLPPDFPVLEIGLSSSPRNTVRFLRRLQVLLRGRKIAGVISHMTGMNRMMLRAQLAGLLSAPVVVVEHSNFLRSYGLAEMPRLRSWLLMKETGFLYRRAHAVVGCSEGVAAQIGKLFGIDWNRLRAIVNPLDPRFRREAVMNHGVAAWFGKLPRPILVSVGRMVPPKGFDDLIRAFAMQREGSLVILGEGPLRPELEALAHSLGLADRIAMPGFLNAPEHILQAADLYVSSSHWEGYPLTLIEAYACGLPVVARMCDFGPAEIVLPDRPGRLVQSGDVTDLASAITECLSNETRFPPGMVVDLSENDPDHVAARYRDLFLEGR
jgi:glycosyltransferase involved in cell wall biosynthesis